MQDTLLPYVSIVVPVFNEERYLCSCLTALEALNYPENLHEILLIDNGSTDQTLEIARRFTNVSIHVIEGVKVGAVRNHGAQIGKGTVVVFLDADCVVDVDWLANGIRKMRAKPDCIFGGQYLLRDDPAWLEKYWILASPGRNVSETSLVGGCIFIPKSIFDKVGGFDESLNAGEDSDLTARLKRARFSVEINPLLSVVHLGNPSLVRPFIARQLWHSSDYINGLPNSLRDKTFLLTLAFISGVIGLLLGLMFLPKTQLALVMSAFLVIICPAVLSAKRIMRAGVRYKSLFDYMSIYLVDFLYLIGRSMGVFTGLKNRLSFRSGMKVGRR